MPRTLVDERYAPLSQLGAGALGVVMLAEDVHLRRKVALKMIRSEHAATPAFARAFRREAAALAAVNNRHVVSVYAFGPHEGGFFFAMEYVKGQTLEEILRVHAEHGVRVPVRRAASILRDLARGLGAAHDAGIVHCDVKPADVVIEEGTGRPVLIDFGIARRSGGSAADGGGTPGFRAPELAQGGEAVTPAADLYSLGCLGFEMLTGHPPHGERTDAPQGDPPPRPSMWDATLAPFDELFARLLAARPQDRPASAAEVDTALRDAIEAWTLLTEGRPSLPPPPSSPAPGSGTDALRVLVVDDDPLFRKLATRAVQLAFFGSRVRISMASSGAEAVTLARAKPPHLVLLDYDMPGQNGVDTLTELRALPDGERARVLVMSGQTRPADRWRFSILGVQHFLDKPITLDLLVEIVQMLAELGGFALTPLGEEDGRDPLANGRQEERRKGLPHPLSAAVAPFRSWRVHGALSADPQGPSVHDGVPRSPRHVERSRRPRDAWAMPGGQCAFRSPPRSPS